MDDLLHKYADHIHSLCGIECSVFDVKTGRAVPKKVCQDCKNQCDFHHLHLYGCYEAQRWDNRYIYYCPKGYIFIAIALLDEVGNVEQGIIAGPIAMGDAEDFDQEGDIPNYSTKNVNDLTELMAVTFQNAARAGGYYVYGQTKEFLNEVYKVLEETPEEKQGKYPIQLEKELQQTIVDGDEPRSKEILNKLLGYIFFNSNSDLKTIKSRVLELIVLLSRAAVEGGADIEQIFALNSGYISEIQNFQTVDKLSLWLSGVINRFISYVFQFGNIKHTDTIFKAASYVKEHYNEKITLDQIANYVYLSKSYLSKIFKEEMNCTLTGYINKVRIDKSKMLLRYENLSIVEIANLVGFDDQSYFTKVFRNMVGISPGKYREKHRRV